MSNRYIVKIVSLPQRMMPGEQEYYYAYDTVEKKQVCTPTAYRPDAEQWVAFLNEKNTVIQYQDLTEEEKEELEVRRKIRAKKENRDLLDDVRCVR